MGRLTEQDEQGNWCVKGLRWKDTYVGQIITENTNEKMYGALFKLKDYEESGLDPEEAYRLKERDTAKKLEQNMFDEDSMTCICESDIDKADGYRFCPWCGQRLDWSE